MPEEKEIKEISEIEITPSKVYFPDKKLIKTGLRDGDSESNEARDRDELLLNAIATGDVEGLGDPRDRLEKFMYAIAGQSAYYNKEVFTDRVISQMTLTKSGSIVTKVTFSFQDGETKVVTNMDDLRLNEYRDLYHRVQIVLDGSDYWGIITVLNDFSTSQPVGFYGMKLNDLWNNGPTSLTMGLVLFNINTDYRVIYHKVVLT